MKPLNTLHRSQAGQAMTEYVLIAAMLVGAAVFPVPGTHPAKSFMSLMIESYRTYYVSYYYVLNLPFP